MLWMIVWMTHVLFVFVRALLARRGFALLLRYLFVSITPFPLYQPCEFWGATEHSPVARALVMVMVVHCDVYGGGDALLMVCVCDGLKAALC